MPNSVSLSTSTTQREEPKKPGPANGGRSPNNAIVAHLNNPDDYSFHSTMASSLCLGWITDAADFDFKKGKRLLGRYRDVRHLLIGAWYPLLPYTRNKTEWMVSQYHRPDLNEGMILAFRHSDSPYREVDGQLRGLDANATYEIKSDLSGKSRTVRGADLMKQFQISLPGKKTSDLITYRKT